MDDAVKDSEAGVTKGEHSGLPLDAALIVSVLVRQCLSRGTFTD